MGPYCNYCGRRCFLPRVIPGGPDKGRSLILATCPRGMALDLETTGYTHETALNPVTQEEAVEALATEMRGEAAPASSDLLDDLLDGVLRDGVPASARVTSRRGYGTSARTVNVRLPGGPEFSLTVDAVQASREPQERARA